MKSYCFLFFLLILACSKKPIETPRATTPTFTQTGNVKTFTNGVEVIFVGNSQTYLHNVPQMVQEMGESDKNFINVTDYSKPDYSLEDHWNEGIVQKVLSEKRWQYMVGQQGSSALPESQVLLKQYAKYYGDVCKIHGIKMNLYMVWPMKSRLFDLDNVIYSYTQAAKHAEASLSPAGLAWKKVWEEQPNMVLHDADGLHASKKGSILAAMTIYTGLFNKKNVDFIQLKDVAWLNDLTETELTLFKKIISDIMK